MMLRGSDSVKKDEWFDSQLTLTRQLELRTLVRDFGVGSPQASRPRMDALLDRLMETDWMKNQYGARVEMPSSSIVLMNGSAARFILSTFLLCECDHVQEAWKMAWDASGREDVDSFLDTYAFPKLDHIMLRVRFATAIRDRFYIYSSESMSKSIFESESWDEVRMKLQSLDVPGTVPYRYLIIVPSITLNFQFLTGIPASSPLHRRASLRIEVLEEGTPVTPTLVADPLQHVICIQWKHQRADLSAEIRHIVSMRSSLVRGGHPDAMDGGWEVDEWIAKNVMSTSVDAIAIDEIRRGVTPSPLSLLGSIFVKISDRVCMDDERVLRRVHAESLMDEVIPLYVFDSRRRRECPVWGEVLQEIRATSREIAIHAFYESYQPLPPGVKYDDDLLYNHRRFWFEFTLGAFVDEMNRRFASYASPGEMAMLMGEEDACGVKRLYSMKNGLGVVDGRMIWNDLYEMIRSGDAKDIAEIWKDAEEGTRYNSPRGVDQAARAGGDIMDEDEEWEEEEVGRVLHDLSISVWGYFTLI